MISIYTMAFNEEHLLQFMINHYRNRFPNCEINLFDNQSTDNTKEIALKNNCNIFEYNTNGLVDDQKLTEFKNSCWKSSKTDWVLICDVDELFDITENDLKNEESKNTTIIKSTAYNMINMFDNFDFENIKHGVRDTRYDKSCLFNKKYIQEINYSAGAHKCSPIGVVKYSSNVYKLYHHNGYNIEHLVKRHSLTSNRICENNKKRGWGITYYGVSAEEKRKSLLNSRKIATKIIQ